MATPERLRSVESPKLTNAQAKFWAILQNPDNWGLQIGELCRLAGYRNYRAWYAALDDDTFRKMVESIDFAIDRKSRGVVPLAKNPEAEWARDVVDVRRLVKDYPKHCAGARFKLDFSFICNAGLKGLIKRYFRARIGFWEPGTLRRYLEYLKPFLMGFQARYPALESFASLSREMAEPILTQTTWLDGAGRQQAITADGKRSTAVVLDGMFTYMQRHGWEGAPPRTIIFPEDKPRLPKKRPRPIPQSVMEQLRANIHLLPPDTQNLVQILAVAGLRASDALHLVEDCLDYDAAGDPRLKWFNHKMKQDGRPLPVNQAVVQAIQSQRDLVRDVPDHFGKHYLFRTARGVLQFVTVCKHLNTLAKNVPILGVDGEVFHFTPHQFRHTVGTEMINNGMGIADVMAYLGHQSPEMTLRYAEIHDETLKRKFKQVVLSSEVVGGAALKVLQDQLAKGDESELDWIVSNLRRLSLPFGYCLHHQKAPACPHANACFTAGNGSPCAKLVTTPEFLPVLQKTLIQIEDNVKAGQEHGWEMYVSNQENQASGLRQVIQELQLPADQRPTNRGGKQS